MYVMKFTEPKTEFAVAPITNNGTRPFAADKAAFVGFWSEMTRVAHDTVQNINTGEAHDRRDIPRLRI